MTLKTVIQKVSFLFILGIVLLLLVGVLWGVHFPGDTSEDFSALHVITNIILIAMSVASVSLSIAGLSERDQGDGEEWVIKKSFIAWPLSIILISSFLFWATTPFGKMKDMYNQHISYINEYEKIEYQRQTFFDKMYKTYLLKYDICELNRETFIEVTKIIMEGRHDGQQVSWKWVHENQNIPYTEFTKFYSDLSQFVNSQREGYYGLEVKAMEVVQKNNTMIHTWPECLYNKILNIPEMKFEPGFTSAHTKEVFERGEENI